MKIQQFEDKHLSQYSYAILSEKENQIVLVDPARDPRPYFSYAEEKQAAIIGVIETHPHADFVSSHLEIQQRTGAKIYASKLIGASYHHSPFDEGDSIPYGEITLKALNTPGHSPDSISIVAEETGRNKAVFTGDTLFIGDCGRPDLRESGEDQNLLREQLAKKMYSSLRDKLMRLEDDVILYPGHGAGTLCGKALSQANSSTIGAEKMGNWSLQPMSMEQFVKELTSDLPFIPAYFSFDVNLNKKGAPAFAASIEKVRIAAPVKDAVDASRLQKELWIVDLRDEQEFKKGHLAHSVNIMDGDKFETWLGSIIKPGEAFYLAGKSREQLKRMIERTAAIGYESQLKEAFVTEYRQLENKNPDLRKLKEHPEQFTIVDVRTPAEIREKQFFPNSIQIPLAELRERFTEIPTDKPVAVHCAGGYRSAAASSLLSSALAGKTEVFDISEAIKDLG